MAHEADDMDTPTIAIVGLIAAGATFAAIYLIMWLYYFVSSAQETANMTDPYKEADRVMAGQQAILNEVGWVDQNTGQMRIPVSDAMGLVVKQLQQTPEDAGVDPEQFRGVDATNTGGGMNASAARDGAAESVDAEGTAAGAGDDGAAIKAPEAQDAEKRAGVENPPDEASPEPAGG